MDLFSLSPGKITSLECSLVRQFCLDKQSKGARYIDIHYGTTHNHRRQMKKMLGGSKQQWWRPDGRGHTRSRCELGVHEIDSDIQSVRPWTRRDKSRYSMVLTFAEDDALKLIMFGGLLPFIFFVWDQVNNKSVNEVWVESSTSSSFGNSCGKTKFACQDFPACLQR